MKKEIAIRVDGRRYDRSVIRYAAYALSGEAYVFLRPGRGASCVEVVFRPKDGGDAAPFGPRFAAELADEKLRAGIMAGNCELRERVILKALSDAPPPAEAGGLTPEQEKELDALIAQVEREIEDEPGGAALKDPLGITSTWEEKYGNRRAKAKK